MLSALFQFGQLASGNVSHDFKNTLQNILVGQSSAFTYYHRVQIWFIVGYLKFTSNYHACVTVPCIDLTDFKTCTLLCNNMERA